VRALFGGTLSAFWFDMRTKESKVPGGESNPEPCIFKTEMLNNDTLFG
jgi:hypothetical protein